jgi:hypothetical protein
MTSMARELGKSIDPHAVREHVIRHFGEVFGIAWMKR